jgi:hypothetical protein
VKLDLVGNGLGKLKAMVGTDMDMEMLRVMDMDRHIMAVVRLDDL